MPFWTPHCSNETHKNDIVITFILLFEYPTTTTSSISWGVYTGSNEVWGDVTMLTITDFSLDHIMLLVFSTLISPSPSIRCSSIYHSLHAAIVFSRIVDSVYLVCIHNGWWFSYPVIWFGPSEGRNDKASWLWPSSRPNQILLILMDYCTWQFLVSLLVPTRENYRMSKNFTFSHPCKRSTGPSLIRRLTNDVGEWLKTCKNNHNTITTYRNALAITEEFFSFIF